MVMKLRMMLWGVIVVGLAAISVQAFDWPQWRGANRDAKAADFKTPATWPKELNKQWSVTVGDGVATPSLAGDKLYVFSRQENQEILRCLNAADGKEAWNATYSTRGADGPAQGFAGPRATPAVIDGKVVTLSVRGTVSCYDAAAGKLLWRNEEYNGSAPRFYTSSSPIVEEGICVVQVGGEGKGAILALDLSTGSQKWKWDGDGTAYASPIIHSVEGVKEVVAETAKNIVGIGLADGKLLWQIAFPVEGGRGYNSSSPVADGATVIFGGSNRGTRAVQIVKEGDKFSPQELWTNKDNSVMYNTPVLTNGLLFGLSSSDKLYCINEKTGKTAWTESLLQSATSSAQPPPGKTPPAKGAPGKGMGGRGMRAGGGYGSIVEVGSALVALTPQGRLLVFAPSDSGYRNLASYKVAAGETYAYPVLDGNRIFIKDKDAVTLWTVE
jgi:outer membrane protein assembly factor BamB